MLTPPNWPRGPELLDQLIARRNQELLELKMAEMLAPQLLAKLKKQMLQIHGALH